MLLWGSNARAAHPIFFHHVLKGIHNGMRLVVVDPRRTESAEWGDLWLGLDVGSDIGLSNTIAREIIANDLQHHTFIERATLGFDEYRDSVMDWTLERGEEVTGVPADVIREVAHAYAKADRAMICWTLGITEHHNAVDNVLALINLALLTGHVGVYGSGVNPLRGPEQRAGRRRHGRDPEQARGLPGHRARRRGPRPIRGGLGRADHAQVRLDAHADVRGDGARRAHGRVRDRREPGPRARPTTPIRCTCWRTSTR
jgi:formate dehydrogenase major subunit